MSPLRPIVVPVAPTSAAPPPGAPRRCAGRIWERSRLEWRLGDPGDPADLVEAFLAAAGLPVADLAEAAPNPAADPPVPAGGGPQLVSGVGHLDSGNFHTHDLSADH